MMLLDLLTCNLCKNEGGRGCWGERERERQRERERWRYGNRKRECYAIAMKMKVDLFHSALHTPTLPNLFLHAVLYEPP